MSDISERARAAQELATLLGPLIQDGGVPPGQPDNAPPECERSNILSAIESLLRVLTPDRPLYPAFHDGKVHDPLGRGAYAFQKDLVELLMSSLAHDESFSANSVPQSNVSATPRMPRRPIVFHVGAQPNNCPHCGTLIVFCYAFAMARAIRDRMEAMAASCTKAEFQPPPVSVEITFVDTAPVSGKGVEIDGIQYQRSYRDTPDASNTWTGDYYEVIGFLSRWSDIPAHTATQASFFSNPNMPQLLEYVISNRHVLGPQLSPKYGTLALRAACPVPGCGLAEKHGRLNKYSYAPPSPASEENNSDPNAHFQNWQSTPPPETKTTTVITFHCPDHSPHTVDVSSSFVVPRSKANTPARNLLCSMTHLLDNSTHHVRITGAEYAGNYQEMFLYRPLAAWQATCRLAKDRAQGRTPHILYAPLIVDWSGAKLSKSLYVAPGGYDGMRELGTDGLGSWRALKERVGGDGDEEGLRRIWEEVVRWVDDPRKVFRCFSVE
ncbi:uncharacterized protein C8A04DRAFT_15516 [Dichotomopilus funicola]|uniref:Uncharacterized protein n=1 Tax=Dichotomopilus funicola TaxID=1934379 RepID=A0AAN6UVJ5_9PEZI|nr:hypothetical protein C8A04DRAFT_15516 [Dichotomopilus funicola]